MRLAGIFIEYRIKNGGDREDFQESLHNPGSDEPNNLQGAKEIQHILHLRTVE